MKTLAILLLIALTGCSQSKSPEGYTRTVPIMNTFLEIKVPDTPAARASVDGALETARRLEKTFSAYDPESEINALNLDCGGRISPDLYAVLKTAMEISALTDGEFDVTVAPVLKKEGFYKDMPASLAKEMPDIYEKGSWKNIALSPNGKYACLLKPVWIDLSGIAKGYIVDRISGYLKKRGIKNFLVNAGGDMYCGGAPGTEKKWTIGLREPGTENMLLVLTVEKKGVATSGDYENFVAGVGSSETISHIIDPRSAGPLEKKGVSVTVIAPTCMVADALATGMMAMGPEAAVKLADELEGIEAIAVAGDISMSYNVDGYIAWKKK